MLIWLIAAAGFLTAALSGIAGVGGGTILIGLLYAFGLTTAQAVPLHAAVQLVSNASRVAAFLKSVEWSAARWFILGCAPAPFLVAPWVVRADSNWVQLLLAALILVSLLPAAQKREPVPLRGAMVFAGVLTGGLGMFVGASGLFIGRLFLRPEWPKQTVVATLALCQSAGHLLKLLGYASVGLSALAQVELLAPLTAAVIAGTLAGRWAHDFVGETQFRRAFNAILLVLSLKLIHDSVVGLGWIAWN